MSCTRPETVGTSNLGAEHGLVRMNGQLQRDVVAGAVKLPDRGLTLISTSASPASLPRAPGEPLPFSPQHLAVRYALRHREIEHPAIRHGHPLLGARGSFQEVDLQRVAHVAAARGVGLSPALLARRRLHAGKAYWISESDRLCGLGADVQQTFIIMANAFFNTPEYLGRNRTDSQFVTDLYVTFFGRLPEPDGLNYWVGQLAQGNPRNNVMSSFLLVAFRNSSRRCSSVFQNPPARAETYLVLNLYGGLFRRLAETGGYNFWTGQFRAAQCDANPVQAVTATIDSVSSQFVASVEYAARNTSNGQFVEDMYYALLQRGAELDGYAIWVGNWTGRF